MTTLYKLLIQYRNNKTKNCEVRNEALVPYQEKQQKIIDAIQLTPEQLKAIQFQPYQVDLGGLQSASAGQQIQAMKQLQASLDPEWKAAEEEQSKVWATYFEKKDNTVNRAASILQNNDLGFVGKLASSALRTYEHYMNSVECAVNSNAAKGYQIVHPEQDVPSYI